MNRMRRTPPQRRGIAMLLVLISMAAAMTLVMGWLASQDNSALVGANSARAAGARSAAQSGLDLAAAILESEAPWQDAHQDGWLLEHHDIGGGVVSVLLKDETTGQAPTSATSLLAIEATATLDGISQTASALATVHPFDNATQGDLSGYAIWTDGSLRISGNARVRSWSDSGQGARVLACIGDLNVTGRARRDFNTGDIRLHGENGDNGDTASRIAALPLALGSMGLAQAPPPPHGVGYTTADGLTLANNEHHEVQGSLTISDNVVLERDAVLRIIGPADIVIDGDLVMERGSSIQVDPGALVRIVVDGDVDLTGAIIGIAQSHRRGSQVWEQRHIDWTDPERIMLLSAGNDQAEWDLDRGTLVQGIIEATGCDLTIDRSTVLGRVAAEDVALKRGSRLFYDHRMDSRTGLSALTELSDRLDLMDLHDGGLDQWARADMLERLGAMLSSPESVRITAPVDGWWVHRPIPIDYVMRRCGGDVTNWENTAMAAANDTGDRP